MALRLEKMAWCAPQGSSSCMRFPEQQGKDPLYKGILAFWKLSSSSHKHKCLLRASPMRPLMDLSALSQEEELCGVSHSGC